MTLRIRHLAQVNPSTPAFDVLPMASELTFMPLETVWADARLDTSRVAIKSDVSSGYVRFQDGDVIVPKTAPTFQHARTTVVDGLVNGLGAGSSELHLLRPKPGVEARFLAYVTRSAAFIAEGVTNYQGVAGLQRVPADFVANWPVLTCTSEEQRRIADFLDDQIGQLDTAIDLRNRQARLLRARATAHAESLLRPVQGWIEVPARHLINEVAVGIVIQPAALYTHSEEGVPAVRGTDISPGCIDENDLIRISHGGHAANRRSTLRAGDVLVVRSGRAGAASRVPKWLVGGNCIDVVIVRPGPEVDSGYLEHSINSPRAQESISEHSTGAIQRHFGVEAMRALPLVRRPLTEQLVIAADLDRSREEHERAVNLVVASRRMLIERKQALITAAVTGQVDVTTARAVA